MTRRLRLLTSSPLAVDLRAGRWDVQLGALVVIAAAVFGAVVLGDQYWTGTGNGYDPIPR